MIPKPMQTAENMISNPNAGDISNLRATWAEAQEESIQNIPDWLTNENAGDWLKETPEETESAEPIKVREISVSGALKEGLSALNRKTDELIDKGLELAGKSAKTALRTAIKLGTAYFGARVIAGGDRIDALQNNVVEGVRNLTQGSSEVVQQAVQQGTQAVAIGAEATQQVAAQGSEVAQQVGGVAQQVGGVAQQYLTRAYEAVAPVAQSIAQEVVQQAPAAFSAAKEIAIKGVEAAALGVAGVEAILVGRETVKAVGTLSKDALNTVAKAVDYAVPEAVIPLGMEAIPAVAGGVIGSEAVKTAATLFVEMPAHIALNTAKKVLEVTAAVNDAITNPAAKIADTLDVVTKAFSGSTRLAEDSSESDLTRASNQLEAMGHGEVAKGLSMFEKGIRALGEVSKRAREASSNAVRNAAKQRELANSVDAAIDMIPGLVSKRLEAKSTELLEMSATKRSEIIGKLEMHYAQVTPEAVMNGAVARVVEVAKQGVQNYKQDSVAYKIGQQIMVGVGTAKKAYSNAKQAVTTGWAATQQAAGNLAAGAQQLGNATVAGAQQAVSNAQQFGQTVKDNLGNIKVTL